MSIISKTVLALSAGYCAFKAAGHALKSVDKEKQFNEMMTKLFLNTGLVGVKVNGKKVDNEYVKSLFMPSHHPKKTAVISFDLKGCPLGKIYGDKPTITLSERMLSAVKAAGYGTLSYSFATHL